MIKRIYSRMILNVIHKERDYKMTIENGYYIAECTSEQPPASRKDSGTFYLPFGIQQNEEGVYEYQEYRFNLPINYEIPIELIEIMEEELDEYRKSLQEVGVL